MSTTMLKTAIEGILNIEKRLCNKKIGKIMQNLAFSGPITQKFVTNDTL
jgi:hypothetical protein